MPQNMSARKNIFAIDLIPWYPCKNANKAEEKRQAMIMPLNVFPVQYTM